MTKVYLAGGFRSNWQKEVKTASVKRGRRELYEFIEFWDPYIVERGKFAEKKEWSAKEYTQWDLHAIRQCDIVFAYLEKGNPGLGMIAECGYAMKRDK